MSVLYASNHLDLFFIALISSLFTVFYMFRMMFVLFSSEATSEPSKNSVKSMIYPMAILTLLSVFAGMLNLPEIFGGNLTMSSWMDLADRHIVLSHTDEIFLMSVNTVLVLFVLYYAYKRYEYNDTILKESNTSLVANKFYIDALYKLIIVKHLYSLSFFFDRKISNDLIDTSINSMALNYKKLGKLFSILENGNVRFYALYMLLGLVSGFIYLFLVLKAML